jgi:hypothetical protein
LNALIFWDPNAFQSRVSPCSDYSPDQTGNGVTATPEDPGIVMKASNARPPKSDVESNILEPSSSDGSSITDRSAA